MNARQSSAELLERVRDALRRRDYAQAAELAEEVVPTGEARPVGERMRRIFDEKPPGNDAAPAAQDEGRQLAAE
jgi:hypothetical protein